MVELGQVEQLWGKLSYRKCCKYSKVSCGSGSRSRGRACTGSSFEGLPCPGEDNQMESCIEAPCPGDGSPRC